MNCSALNTYHDQASIVERFANDQQYWSGQSVAEVGMSV